MVTHFLETLTEELVNFNCQLYLMSLHQLCIIDRGGEVKEGTGSGGVNLLIFHETFSMKSAVAIRAHVYIVSPTFWDH